MEWRLGARCGWGVAWEFKGVEGRSAWGQGVAMEWCGILWLWSERCGVGVRCGARRNKKNLVFFKNMV